MSDATINLITETCAKPSTPLARPRKAINMTESTHLAHDASRRLTNRRWSLFGGMTTKEKGWAIK